MMKKIIILGILFLLLAFISSPVLAENRPIENRMIDKSQTSTNGAMKEDKMEKRADNLKERANKEISRRLESLTRLLARVNEFKKLSTTQKTALATQIQTEIDKLTALQTKIAADTDQEMLKADVKSIVDSYRIYALFIPKIEIIGAAERILTVSDEMTAQEARLEAKLPILQGKGENVTEPQALLTDMKAKIIDAKTQAQQAIDTVTPLTPEGFPANRTQLQSARQMLVLGVQDLHVARQDARSVIVWLVQIATTPVESTPPVTTTP